MAGGCGLTVCGVAAAARQWEGECRTMKMKWCWQRNWGKKKRVLFLTRDRRFCGKKETFGSCLDIIWLKFEKEKVFEIGVDLSLKEDEKNQQELKYKNKLPGTKEKERI